MVRASRASIPTSTATHRTGHVCLIRGGAVRFAERPVLGGVDLAVGPADRLAVIGDNGSGKSTLLGALAGTVTLTAGERLVEVPGGLALAEQRPAFPYGTSVGGAVDVLLAELRGIESAIQETAERLAGAHDDEQPALLRRLADLTDRFEARDGYGADLRVDAALEQLGLGGLDRTRPVGGLSGGERARLALAAALASRAELLLLDEPTNDLDDTGLAWLEERLAAHRGALVVVTHDRAFLDRFATDVIAIEDGTLRRYGNGYAGYLTARATERRRLRERYDAWRQDVARNEALVASNASHLAAIPRRQELDGFGHGAFRARGRDHGAMSRIRMAKERVARLKADPAVRPPDPLRFAPHFDDRPAGDDAPLFTVAGVRLGARGPRLVLDELEIRAGERWLVTGPNGAGKTTLLRTLAGELTPDQGTVTRHPGVRVAWLRQDLASGSRRTLVQAFAAATGTYAGTAAETLLALGLFHPDDLGRRLAELSVGQRRRYEVAVALTAPSDVLLLDEPTNHLAPELVEQLEDALLTYPGATITVTHDRRWRARAAARDGLRTIHVAPGGVVTAERSSPDTGQRGSS